MKLFNTCVVWDIYTVAESHEAARAAAEAMIKSGELNPSESVALEVKRENEVREAWRNERPLVGQDISDADFEKLKGKTTHDVFAMLHVKPEASPELGAAGPAKNGKASKQPAASK